MFVIITLFSIMLIILLTNVYLQLHFQPEILERSFKTLIQTKPHGHDNISICMVKICGDSIGIRLEKIFKETLLTGVSRSEWKKWNIVPILKNCANKTLKILTQFLYFQFLLNNLKHLFLTICLTISHLINLSLKTSTAKLLIKSSMNGLFSN